jgi:hypothetical protein
MEQQRLLHQPEVAVRVPAAAPAASGLALEPLRRPTAVVYGRFAPGAANRSVIRDARCAYDGATAAQGALLNSSGGCDREDPARSGCSPRNGVREPGNGGDTKGLPKFAPAARWRIDGGEVSSGCPSQVMSRGTVTATQAIANTTRGGARRCLPPGSRRQSRCRPWRGARRFRAAPFQA